MKIIAVSQDRETLMQVVESLEEVFPESDVVPCFDPLMASQMCAKCAKEIGLVVCSVIMQPLTGFEFMEQVKRIPEIIPVFMIVSTNDMELKTLAVMHGAKACITLPVTTDKIRQATDFYFAGCEWDGGECPESDCGQQCIREWCTKWTTRK